MPSPGFKLTFTWPQKQSFSVPYPTTYLYRQSSGQATMSPQQPPPQSGQAATLDPAWFALRSQQQKELTQFDRSFETAREELRQRFEAELADKRRNAEVQRAQLLVYHQQQDKDLWMRCKPNVQSAANGGGLPASRQANSNNTVSQGSAVTPQQAIPVVETNTPQHDRPASATQKTNTTTVASLNQNVKGPTATPKKAWPSTWIKTPKTYGRRRTKYDGFTDQPSPELEKSVSTISLLSDDEDDEDDMPLMLRLARSKATSTANKTTTVPAPPTPSASTKDPKIQSVSCLLYSSSDTILIAVKQIKTNAQVADTPPKALADKTLQKDNGTIVNAEPAKPRTDLPVRPSRSTAAPRRPPTKAALRPDKRPEIPFSNMRQQRMDRSSILRQPVKLARSQNLRSLEQKKNNGAFVKDILNNERRHRLSPNLGNVLSPPGRGSHMEEDDTSLSKFCYIL
jgi:hypothetical protein